eukprot:gene6837-7555_t
MEEDYHLEKDLSDLNINLNDYRNNDNNDYGDDNDNNDIVRGYGLETNHHDVDEHDYFMHLNDNHDKHNRHYINEEYEIEEEYELEEDVSNKEDKAPEMPQEFYQQIDDFLKKPPPNFTAKDVIKKKSKNNNNNSHNNNSNSNRKKSSISLKKDNPISSRVYDTIAPNQQTSSNAPAIDSQLLKEAFEYTDRLLREAVMEEVLEKQSVADPRQHGKHAGNNGGDNSGTRQPKQSSRLVSKYAAYVEERGQDIAYDNNGMFPKSAPAEVMRQESSKAHGDVGRKGMNKRESNSGSGRSGSGGMGAVKMVRNLKSKSNQELTTASAAPTTRRQQSLAGGDFVVTRETETDLKRIPVDFDSLLSNFQTGATLDKLRKELAESQQSLAQSELIVQQLTGLKSLGGAGKKRRG